MELDCMNSAERAYQVPRSIDAHACNSPTGNMLRMTMKINPKFRHQKGELSGVSFHLWPGFSALEAEQREAKPEHPVHAEQCRVAVDRSEVQSLDVIQRDRRIDEKAKQACSNQVQ